MGETEKKTEPEELKEIKTAFISFQGTLNLSKLFDQKIQEAFKRESGNDLMIPFAVFAYKEKKFVLLFYEGPEAYKAGKAILASEKSEDVKEFYATLKKILS